MRAVTIESWELLKSSQRMQGHQRVLDVIYGPTVSSVELLLMGFENLIVKSAFIFR